MRNNNSFYRLSCHITKWNNVDKKSHRGVVGSGGIKFLKSLLTKSCGLESTSRKMAKETSPGNNAAMLASLYASQARTAWDDLTWFVLEKGEAGRT